MPVQFNGQLNTNSIYTALYNMIIGQYVSDHSLSKVYSQLLNDNRKEGTMYGDTLIYYAVSPLSTKEWKGDAEAANLLKLNRAKAPEQQAFTIDQFRQISLTLDDYLSKQAWGTPSAFSDFNSAMMKMMNTTKEMYETSLFNSFVGTTESTTGNQDITITLPDADGATDETNQEAARRMTATMIAEKLGDLVIDMQDFTSEYNDYGIRYSYDPSELAIVWNASVYNTILKRDLPTIFHKDGLLDGESLKNYVIPERYFGKVNASGGTVAASNKTIRSLIETDYKVSEVVTHVFPGELLPDGATYEANTTYTEDNTILFKIIGKESVPFMSGFTVTTSFYNPASLTTNYYTTFGYNTLDYRADYPFVTVRGDKAGA